MYSGDRNLYVTTLSMQGPCQRFFSCGWSWDWCFIEDRRLNYLLNYFQKLFVSSPHTHSGILEFIWVNAKTRCSRCGNKPDRSQYSCHNFYQSTSDIATHHSSHLLFRIQQPSNNFLLIFQQKQCGHFVESRDSPSEIIYPKNKNDWHASC